MRMRLAARPKRRGLGAPGGVSIADGRRAMTLTTSSNVYQVSY